MIMSGCAAFAQVVGPTRIEAELLPQWWEQVQCAWTIYWHRDSPVCCHGGKNMINVHIFYAALQIGHKYVERRLLVAEACGGLAPYLPVNNLLNSLGNASISFHFYFNAYVEHLEVSKGDFEFAHSFSLYVFLG